MVLVGSRATIRGLGQQAAEGGADPLGVDSGLDHRCRNLPRLATLEGLGDLRTARRALLPHRAPDVFDDGCMVPRRGCFGGTSSAT